MKGAGAQKDERLARFSVGWPRLLLFVVLAAALLAWPFVLPSFTHFYGVLSIVYAIVGVSLTVLAGWTGQISLGHAAFLGVGVYGTAALLDAGLPLPAVFFLVAIIGGLGSLVLGVPSLRLKGVYLSIVTLAFGVAAENFLLPLDIFAGGEDAQVITRPEIFGLSIASDRGLYYLALAVGGLCFLLVRNLRRSPVGRSLFAIRDSEKAAQSLGIRLAPYKIGAFALSASLACLAGVIYGLLFTATPAPSQFGVIRSLFLLAIPVVGGLEWISGAAIGGILIAVGHPVFNAFDIRILLASGVLLALVLLSRTGGIVGSLAAASSSLSRNLTSRAGERRQPVKVIAPPTLRVQVDNARMSANGHPPRVRVRLVRGGED